MAADVAPMRAAFEAWFSDAGKWPDAVRRSGNGYTLASAQSSWEAWQACWPQARAAIYAAEQAQIEAPLRERLARAEHWAQHAMLMRSSQNIELLRILRGQSAEQAGGGR